MDVQARIPPALCALHNFICLHDPEEILPLDDEEGPEHEERYGESGEHRDYGGHGELSTSGVVPSPEKDRAEIKRDDLANEMWNQYLKDIQASNECTEVD